MKIIDSDKKYMYPDVEHMKEWFDEFNARFWDNKLPPIEFHVGYRGSGKKHTLGFFRNPSKHFPVGVHPEKCFISLNATFFIPEDEWRNTMVHEMVHYFVYMKYGKTAQGHGKEFKAEAKRISAISEFEIDTCTKEKCFRPSPSITDHWGEKFDEEVILGNYYQGYETWIEDYEDEETNEIIPIERPRYDRDKSFSFRTKSRYVPEIIDNLRNVRGKIEWFRVDEGCQKLFLLPITAAVPSFKPDEINENFFYEESLFEDDFGPIKWTPLGTTEFLEDGNIQGYLPGQRKDEFRQKYFRDAKEIGQIAAEMLVKRYVEHPRWYTSTVHATYNAKPSCSEYTIQVDSRFKPLVAMTPKKILINPVHSDVMMDYIKASDTESLANEISRVISSRQ